MQDIDDLDTDEGMREYEQSVRVQEITNTLQILIDGRMTKRANLEEEWRSAELQYRGEYEPNILESLKGKSQAFYQGTRKLCNFAESRLGEMLFPTAGRNFAIAPTPIPDMPDGLDASQVFAVAQDRAGKMQQRMDDQLSECGYNAEARKMIHEMVKLGTGVMKGPIVRAKQSKRYQRNELPMGIGVEYAITIEQEYVPEFKQVSVWDFYPDPDSPTIADSENVFERHRLTSKQLKDLAKLPGFDKDAICELLKQEPGHRLDGSSIEQLNDAGSGIDRRYHIWEFTGSLSAKDAECLCGDQFDAEVDPLADVRIVAWFCDNILLKAVPYDSDELPYSVDQWDEDPHCIFGKGLPYRVRNSQRAANSCYRLILDHAPHAALPQRIIADDILEPVDGSYLIRPGKEWRLKRGADARSAFANIETPANIQMLMELFAYARQQMEDEAGLPMLAQTGQEPQVTQTATGTAMLMNSASTPLRRMVKSFDDNITVPNLRRLYRWNMEFLDDDAIKGDYDVVPLGSSSLLVREQQVSGLLQLIQLAQASPILAPLTKFPEIYRKAVEAMQINAEAAIKSDEELKAEAEAQAQQPGQPDPETLKIQLAQSKVQLETQKLQMAQQEMQIKAQIKQAELQLEAQRNQLMAQDSQNDLARTQITAQTSQQKILADRQLMLAKMANEANQTVQQIQAQLGLKKMEIDSRNQQFNAEQQMKYRLGSGI